MFNETERIAVWIGSVETGEPSMVRPEVWRKLYQF
jgi:hypothetical protein